MSPTKRLLAILAAVLLTACSVIPAPVPVPVPPEPVPIPVPPEPEPIDPVTPVEPVDDVTVVSREKVALVVEGLSETDLVSILGKPVGDRDQRDGTRILRWATTGSSGDKRWMDVQVEGGKVIGRALVRRR